uniref:Uncharacterized protein n=1 Tax=Sciurus vulgaris TaxID=55149 RepID=A0A8D2DMT8_SCIVU
MAGTQPLALQLEQLNLRPREVDPEADTEEATDARVIGRFDEGEDGEDDFLEGSNYKKLCWQPISCLNLMFFLFSRTKLAQNLPVP